MKGYGKMAACGSYLGFMRCKSAKEQSIFEASFVYNSGVKHGRSSVTRLHDQIPININSPVIMVEWIFRRYNLIKLYFNIFSKRNPVVFNKSHTMYGHFIIYEEKKRISSHVRFKCISKD